MGEHKFDRLINQTRAFSVSKSGDRLIVSIPADCKKDFHPGQSVVVIPVDVTVSPILPYESKAIDEEKD